MTESIGQIVLPNGTVLCKMWLVSLSPRTRSFLPHRHREVEMSCLLKGSGIYQTEHREYQMRSGDCFMFCSQEIHCITTVKEEIELLNLQFLPEFVQERLVDFSGHDFKGMLYTHNKEFINRFPSSDFADLMRSVRKAFEEQGRDLLICGKISELLLYVIDQRNIVGSRNDYPQTVILYINDHFRENVTMADLSALVGISPNHLSKVFKDACGISVWEYLSLTRINFAKKRLTQTSDNIIDIAMESGYNNTANFNKMFKKYTAMTPLKYRACAKQKINVDI